MKRAENGQISPLAQIGSSGPYTAERKRIPEHHSRRLAASVAMMKAIAARVMEANNIQVTRLYAAVVDKLELGGGIHWSQQGYGIMAQAITENIERALKTPVVRTDQEQREPPAGQSVEQASDTPLPATARPVSKEGKGWQRRHEAMNERVQQGNVDLIFVGDSITQFWEHQDKGLPTWEKYYAHRDAVNLGISGDRTQHVLWRLQNGNLDGISPKVAVVMIGTNNSGADSSQDIAAGVKAIVETIEEKCPTTRILVLGIFPRGKNSLDRRQIVNEGANALLETLADDRTIFYMDIGAKLLEEDGTLSRENMPDLLHPGAKGHQIWAESIEEKLKELLEDE